MTAKKTVLIVDDSEEARQVLSAILDHDGYLVLVARDGVEALSLAQHHLPDLVITDIRMPRMGGFEAAEELRKDGRTRHIPVVAMTAERFDSLRLERAREVFHSLLWKPLRPGMLMEHVREILHGS